MKENGQKNSRDSIREPHFALPWRLLASALILLHIFAVFVAPWHHTHGSPLTTRVYSLFAPYLDLANINYGYDFFSPEPGNAMFLLRYELEFADGFVEQGIFPDRQKHWPRLLYHRYFMLTSKQVTRSRFDESLPSPPEFERWENTMGQTTIATSYARHLLRTPGARQVRIFLVRHRISTREEILDGEKLSRPETYQERPLVELSGVDDRPDHAAEGQTVG